MSYIIGVDAGGTKTEVTAYNLNGDELATTVLGAGNLIEDFSGAVSRINEGIKTVMEQVLTDDLCQRIVIGAAGLNASGRAEQILRELKDNFREEITLIGDGELAHYAILKGRDGELIIAGTGSVIISKRDKSWDSFGGWGPLLGDEGSGYRLGLALVKNCLTELDLKIPSSIISQAVLDYLECKEVRTLPGVLREMSKTEIAAITQVLINHPTDDTVAKGIIETEAESLANDYLKFHKNTYDEKKATLGLNGGIVVNNKIFRDKFLKVIEQKDIIVNQFLPSGRISKGAYYLVMSEKNWSEI